MIVESKRTSTEQVDAVWRTNADNRSRFIRCLETKARVDARFRHQPIIRNGSNDYKDEVVQTISTTLDGKQSQLRTVKPEHFFQYIGYQEDGNEIGTVKLPDIEYERERPQWLKRIAETLVAMQERDILEPDNPLTFTNQIRDPLALMAGPLKFASTKDVELWNMFRESLRHITWNIAISSSDAGSVENNAVEFSN